MNERTKTDRELLLEVSQNVKELVRVRDDHEGRLRAVEKNIWTAAGFVACLSIFGNWLMGWLNKHN